MDRGRGGRDHKRPGARCQRGGWMDRQTMGTVDLAEALHIIMDVEDGGEESCSKQNQQIAVTADIVQHTYTLLSAPRSSFSLGSLFPLALFSHTHTHTRRTASPFELSPPGSRGEGGQSGIYVLQFIFVLEAPRRLSSMLA